MDRGVTDVPVLDLARAEDASLKSAFLVDLRAALLGVGFAYVKNHSVPKDVIANIEALLPKLFALSEAQKKEVGLVNSPHFLGYSNFGSEVTARARDEREQFEFGTELPDVYAASQFRDVLPTRLHGPNQWPQVPPGCRQVVESYSKALSELSLRFLQLIAESLYLPREAFLPFVSQQHRLKLIHYRPSPTGSDASGITQGVGPHKDSSGWLTFLLQASDPSIKGLQALDKAGEWIDVPPIPGTFVVNMGQAFEVLTNGVCKATTHRVLLPPGDYDRYSVPFFQGVRLDLTKAEFKNLWKHFEPKRWKTHESEEGKQIDSPFLKGKYDTWGENQLRTKIRSHQDVGRRFYADIFEKYVHEDA